MARVKSKDTDIEVVVRSALHRRGLRFRKHVKGLSGSPDVVFPRARVAVFVDGDFWHGYKFEQWKHKMRPYWQAKIQANVERDERNFRALRAAGWCVIRVWEHEVKRELDSVLDRIQQAVVEGVNQRIGVHGSGDRQPRS